MIHQIKISYRTGNSFGSHDTEGFIEHDWENLEMAKESLKRIKNHYETYEKFSNAHKKPDEAFLIGAIWNEKYRWIDLELIDDAGKPFISCSFWTGYFERLQRAEIIMDENDLIYEV